MIVQNQEFLDFLFGEFFHQIQLFTCEFKRFANAHFIVDTGPIKYFDEFLANIIEDNMIVSDADYMADIGLTEDFSGGLRVAAGHKYEFKSGLDFPENFSNGLSVHFDTFADVVFKQKVIFLLLDTMSTKVQYLNGLVHPVMKLVHRSWLSDVFNLALDIFQ